MSAAITTIIRAKSESTPARVKFGDRVCSALVHYPGGCTVKELSQSLGQTEEKTKMKLETLEAEGRVRKWTHGKQVRWFMSDSPLAPPVDLVKPAAPRSEAKEVVMSLDDRIRKILSENPGGKDAKAIAAMAGEPVLSVRDQLLKMSDVTHTGKKRGSRWHLGAAQLVTTAPVVNPKTQAKKKAAPKMALLEKNRARVGQVPDRVLAEELNMSPMTVFQFRKKNGIESTRGLPPEAGTALAVKPKAIAAAAKAKVAVVAPPKPKAAPVAKVTVATVAKVWEVRLTSKQGLIKRYVVAENIAAAGALASKADADILGLDCIGQVL